MYLYIWFILPLLACAIISAVASNKVHKTFSAYADIQTASRMTGYDTAKCLLRNGGVDDVSVGRVKGTLTDHYHPKKEIVNLSESTYGSASVAAVAVAAHEIGHVMQKKKGSVLYNIRAALVPIVNFGSRLALPLVFIGFFLDLFLLSTNGSNFGYYLAIVGVCLYGSSFLFTLFTYPVELDASRRAKKMLLEEGVLNEDEIVGAQKVLSAAASTYLASLLTSLVYFLRFLLWVFMLFGGRRRRN